MPSGNASFTIMAWMKKSPDMPGGHRRAVAYGGLSGTQVVWLGYLDGNVNIAHYGVGAGVQALSTGGWEHVVFRYDGAQYTLYLNGRAQGSLAAALDLLPARIWLGSTFHTSGENFKGWLDEVEFYDRALEPAEIEAAFQADGAGHCRSFAVNAADLPAGRVTRPYQAGLTTVFGRTPIAWSVAAGALPRTCRSTRHGRDRRHTRRRGGLQLHRPGRGCLGLRSAADVRHPCRPAPGCLQPPAGLEDWWTADDVSGTTAPNAAGGPAGILVGGMGTQAGKVGQAFFFDGADDAVQAEPAGMPSGSAPFTIMAWMKKGPTCPAATAAPSPTAAGRQRGGLGGLP